MSISLEGATVFAREDLLRIVVIALIAPLGASSTAASAAGGEPRAGIAMASHVGWPRITGMLLMNSDDNDRPLDGRPGHGPFDDSDPSFSCDGRDNFTRCLRGGPEPWRFGPPDAPHLLCHGVIEDCYREVVPTDIGHNELLGGHGDDSIHAGPAGDVLWGDYKPSGQPEGQVDHLYGGPGRDWIYSSHGINYIRTGAGEDRIMLVYGRGVVRCERPGHKVLVVRKLRSNRHFHLIGCSEATLIPYAA